MTNLQGNVMQPEGRITNQISGVKRLKEPIVTLHVKCLECILRSSNLQSIQAVVEAFSLFQGMIMNTKHIKLA